MASPIISLTSYGKRLETVDNTIQQYLKQNIKKICLTIYKDDIINVIKNQKLVSMINTGIVEMLIAKENLKNHLKYWYAMKQYPNDIIITVDDDIIHHPDLIGRLTNIARANPMCVVAMSCVKFNPKEKHFVKFHASDRSFDTNPRFDVVAEGWGGIAYPKGFWNKVKNYHDIFISSDAILKNDDIALYYVEYKEHIPVKYIGKTYAVVSDNQYQMGEEPSHNKNYVIGGLADRCRKILFENKNR